jgi:hypothetical protein
MDYSLKILLTPHIISKINVPQIRQPFLKIHDMGKYSFWYKETLHKDSHARQKCPIRTRSLEDKVVLSDIQLSQIH